MACRWRNAATTIAAVFVCAGVSAGPLDLTVVYPKDGQRIPAVDSTFIFGSVRPGASVAINGTIIEVHEAGGWLAFLPVSPGDFVFEIAAAMDDIIDTATVTVRLPEFPDYSYDSLYFRAGSSEPSKPIWVFPGDEISLSFAGTPYCNAFAIVTGLSDTIHMQESPPRHYYRGRSVFSEDDRPILQTVDSMQVRGLYTGTMTAPDTVCDSLTVIHHLYPPSLAQISWMLKHGAEWKSRSLPYHTFGSLPPLKAETTVVPIRIMDPGQPRVVELTDSLTVIRTGAMKGYLCVHQPAGVRLALIGKDDRWLKVRLSPGQHGWVPDTAAIILPEGSAVPHSYISLVQTVNHPDRVSIRAATSARHPFRVIENLNEKSITVLIYGADSNTDWIRYDNSDSLIDQIIWFQPEPGVYGLTISLTEERIWGYDGHYLGNEFWFDIRKFPSWKRSISDFRFVVDPGHGPDPGAVGPTGLTEKEANLAIARRLQRDLERERAEAILTRHGDDSVALYDRPKIAVGEGADVFISIHNNALPDGVNPFVNNGVSVFYYHPHSAELARMVHNAMVRHLDLEDFDWYYGNLAVNRPTQYPAILVECAFMMIPEHEAKLRTSSFQGEISKAIIEGIKDFLRGGPETEWDRDQTESYDWR